MQRAPQLVGEMEESEGDKKSKDEVISSLPKDGGWLLRFFDSSFFCEWIAVTYLYRHEDGGVRDYLCNRMYSLPLSGIQEYLLQLCFLAVHKPSPSLEKFLVDLCGKSPHAGFRVYWFLLSELEDWEDDEEILFLQEMCQSASLSAEWPPLKCPRPPRDSLSGSQRVFRLVSSASRRFLPIPSSSTSSTAEKPQKHSVTKEAESSKIGEVARYFAPSQCSGQSGADQNAGQSPVRVSEASASHEGIREKEQALPETNASVLRALFPGAKSRNGAAKGDVANPESIEAYLQAQIEAVDDEVVEIDEEARGVVEASDAAKPKESFLLKYFRRKEAVQSGEDGFSCSEASESRDLQTEAQVLDGGCSPDRQEGANTSSSGSIVSDVFLWKMFKEKKLDEELLSEEAAKSEKPREDGFFRRMFREKSEDMGAKALAVGELTTLVEAEMEGDSDGEADVVAGGGVSPLGEEEVSRDGFLKRMFRQEESRAKATGEEDKKEIQNPSLLKRFFGAPPSADASEKLVVAEEEEMVENIFQRLMKGKSQEASGDPMGSFSHAHEFMVAGEAFLVPEAQIAGSNSVAASSTATASGGTKHVSVAEMMSSSVGEVKSTSVSEGQLSNRSGGEADTGSESGIFKRLFRTKTDMVSKEAELLIGGEKPKKGDSRWGSDKAAAQETGGNDSGRMLRKLWSGKGGDGEKAETDGEGVVEALEAQQQDAGPEENAAGQEGGFLKKLFRGRSDDVQRTASGQEATVSGASGSSSLEKSAEFLLEGHISREEPSGGIEGNEEVASQSGSVVSKLLKNTLATAAGAAIGAKNLVGEAASSTLATAAGAAIGAKNLVGEAASKVPIGPFRSRQNSEDFDRLKDKASLSFSLEKEHGSLFQERAMSPTYAEQTMGTDSSETASRGDGMLSRWYKGATTHAIASSVTPLMSPEGHPLASPLLTPPVLKLNGEAKDATVASSATASPQTFLRKFFREKGESEKIPHLRLPDGDMLKGREYIPLVDAPTPAVTASSSSSAAASAAPKSAFGKPETKLNSFLVNPLRGAAMLVSSVGHTRIAAGEGSEEAVLASSASSAEIQAQAPEPTGGGAAGAAVGGAAQVAETFAGVAGQSEQRISSAAHEQRASHKPAEGAEVQSAGGSSAQNGPGKSPREAGGIRQEAATRTVAAAAAAEESLMDETSFFDAGVIIERSSPLNAKAEQPKDAKSREESAAPAPEGGIPKHASFSIRKGTFAGTIDFVKALGDISAGLVDVLNQDREKALKECLAELNAHLAGMSATEGVLFPMGKGFLRLVHILEDDAVLLSSRERVPFMLVLEVLNCQPLSSRKQQSSKTKAGIPLANSHAILPSPPPWALYMWNTKATSARLSLSRTNSDLALDHAMANVYGRMKVVDVTLEISKRRRKVGSIGDELCSVASSKETSASSESRASTPLEMIRRGRGGSGGGAGGDAADSDNEAGVEIYESSEEESDSQSEHSGMIDPNRGGVALSVAKDGYVKVTLTAVPGVTMDDIAAMTDRLNGLHRRVPSSLAIAQVRAATADGQQPPPGLPTAKVGTKDEEAKHQPESWEERKQRVSKTSKFASSPDWDLKSFIVKAGDDCRQEHLAVQLISHFAEIFEEANLPLWLRPYEVLVTSSQTALIETIPDAVSLHSLKRRNPELQSLRDHFVEKFGNGTPEFRQAQQNFVESMAGYSIVTYFLQVKDRHNGNILLDKDGHIVHIDFGFMLSNSPGGVNFENAPFKLTRELVELMDSDAEGSSSEAFDYFKVLCIQGFLTCRKHAERILLLVEMMQDTRCPCFKAGARVLVNLRKRFMLSLTEEQCVSQVLALVSKSLDSWRTRQYDYYQRVLNGIL